MQEEARGRASPLIWSHRQLVMNHLVQVLGINPLQEENAWFTAGHLSSPDL